MFFLKQERFTTGVPVDDRDLNHFVMVLIKVLELNRLCMKLKPLKRFICASANILEILRSVMGLIIIYQNDRLRLNVGQKERYVFCLMDVLRTLLGV